MEDIRHRFGSWIWQLDLAVGNVTLALTGIDHIGRRVAHKIRIEIGSGWTPGRFKPELC